MSAFSFSLLFFISNFLFFLDFVGVHGIASLGYF
uniref:Uncharacterized protein n=1 Tax=Rhizophora mucronata TaxID=61149 RepID=A0A2P2JCB2_RHIMU